MSMAAVWVEAEFETIFREHYQRIVRVTRGVLRRDSEAEEVCAEVFLRLYRSGPGVAEDGLVGRLALSHSYPRRNRRPSRQPTPRS